MGPNHHDSQSFDEAVPQTETTVGRQSRNNWGRKEVLHTVLNHRRIRLVFCSTLVLIVLIVIVNQVPPPLATLSEQHLTEAIDTNASVRPHYLHLVVPASQSDANLCKSVISSSVLGYPPPMLVNWNKTFDNPNQVFGGAHLAKIEGVLNHLNTLNSTNDDDLVLVVDGFDVWFQLRPGVLIERYLDINERANKRISKHLTNAPEAADITQKVVFSAQKKCYPQDEDHPACYAVPHSTLPHGLFGGHNTEDDYPGKDEQGSYSRNRPRYLNSGSCIGSVSAVRAVFEQAKRKVKDDAIVGSDQAVFAAMFGQQEQYRHLLRFHHRRSWQKATSWFARLFGIKSDDWLIEEDHALSFPQKVKIPAIIEDYLQFEYGIGLDYESKLFQSTVFSENDTEWISYGDKFEIQNATQNRKIPLPPRVGSLPQDISQSLPPFYESRLRDYPGGQLPMHSSWNSVPLLTNIYSGYTPVAVHHQAHHDGLRSRLDSHWNQIWFQPYLRALLNARALAPQTKIAITYDANGLEQSWWGPTYQSLGNECSGAVTDTEDWIDYEQLCEGTWHEVLRDGNGVWKDPRFREKPVVEEPKTLEKIPSRPVPIKPLPTGVFGQDADVIGNMSMDAVKAVHDTIVAGNGWSNVVPDDVPG